MSLTYTPNGLSLYDYKGGKATYTLTQYPLASGTSMSIGQGDPVSLVPIANVVWAANTGSPGCVIQTPMITPGNAAISAAQYLPILGVATQFIYTNQQGQEVDAPYWASNTATYNGNVGYVGVNDLPNCEFVIQAKGSITQDQVGANFNFQNSGDDTTSLPAPNPQTGQSTVGLNPKPIVSTTVNSASWGQCTLVGLAASPLGGSNNWGDAFTWVIVRINNHRWRAGTQPCVSAS